MADRPILFSAPMVQAILAGRKTVTRRVLKPQPTADVIHYGWSADGGAFWTDQQWISHRIPIWAGDRLWVRETWACVTDNLHPDEVIYRADAGNADWPHGWRPSIFMPRLASRLTLTVTDVKVERLHEITDRQALAEGVDIDFAFPGTDFDIDGYWWPGGPVRAFQRLWTSINGAESWDTNPWVGAYTFKAEHRNIDARD